MPWLARLSAHERTCKGHTAEVSILGRKFTPTWRSTRGFTREGTRRQPRFFPRTVVEFGGGLGLGIVKKRESGAGDCIRTGELGQRWLSEYLYLLKKSATNIPMVPCSKTTCGVGRETGDAYIAHNTNMLWVVQVEDLVSSLLVSWADDPRSLPRTQVNCSVHRY